MTEVQPDPYLVLGQEHQHAPIVFTCEHATNFIPPEYTVTPSDEKYLNMHWGYDIGVFEVMHHLVDHLKCQGVLANFSRLLCDPNRERTSPTLFLSEVDGHPLSFNQGLDESERERRIQRLYEPYHQAISRTLKERSAQKPRPILIAVHSFTPDFPGSDRSMDIGVLYDRHEEPAERLCDALKAEGFIVGDNAPYSGKAGMMYSAHNHSEEWNLESLELEIRQDHIYTPEKAKALSERLSRALGAIL